jgi:two-component system LytT family sensor kinase
MLVSALWALPALLATLNEIAQRQLGGGRPPRPAELLFAGGDWLIYSFLTPAVFVVARRWPLAKPNMGRHVTTHLAISWLFCVAWAGAGAVLRALLQPEALGGSFLEHLVSWTLFTLPFGVAVYLAVVGTEHATRYFTEARDRELQNARLAEQLSSAQLAALQAQLNPHFLFNTLNTIAVLVRDGDRTGAARLVEHLSDVLRRTLRRHGAPETPLDHELELVRQYLAIEQVRFSDRLQTAFDVDPSVSAAAVPVMAVQHLVENAVRHGIARSADATRVGIAARRDGDVLEVAVYDDGAGVDEERVNIPGHGIQHTRARLTALYGTRASLAVGSRPGGGTIATLRVPFRELAGEARIDGV